MPLDVSTSTVVLELSATTGLGPYVLKPVGNSARFSDFFTVGETVRYAVDNGSSLAEFAEGTMQAGDTIARPATTIWSSNGGAGGALINWPPGNKYVRALVSGGAPGPPGPAGLAPVAGFWTGVVPASAVLQRFLFVDAATAPLDLSGSLANAGTPVASGAGDQIVDEAGNPIVDESNDLMITALSGGDQIVDESGNTLIDETGALIFTDLFGGGVPIVLGVLRNGTQIATITFNPDEPNAVFVMSVTQTFSIGDLLEIVAPSTVDGNLADLTWTLKVSPPP